MKKICDFNFRARHTIIVSNIKKHSKLTKDPNVFVQSLLNADFHISGRYHGVAFSIALGLPFLALRSNTNKIENLLDFVFGDNKRMCEINEIPSADLKIFDDEEKRLIKQFLDSGEKLQQKLFDEILNA